MAVTVHSRAARVVRSHRARVRVTPLGSRVGSRPQVTVRYGRLPQDRLILVRAKTEEPLGEFASFTLDEPSYVLNGIGRLGFTVSIEDPTLDHLTVHHDSGPGVIRMIGVEVQWWRDGKLRWQGVPTKASVNMGSTVVFECADLGYYPSRRVFGSAQNRDLLKGAGSMDRLGLPGWVRTQSCVAVRDVSDKQRGLGSAALTGEGGIEASFVHPPITVGQDGQVNMTAQAKMPVGTPVGTEVISLTVREVPGGPIIDRAAVATDFDYTPGTWQVFTVTAVVPVGGSHYVTAYCRSENDHGTSRFDDVRCPKDDTTGIPAPGKDLVHHGDRALYSWQHTDPDGGWNFHSRMGEPTGTVEVMGVRHSQHTQATDWLQGYTDRKDGFDWIIDIQTRQMVFAKRVGADHVNLVLHDINVSGGSWTHDESTLASGVIVQSNGDGPTRAEGGKSDTSRTNGILLHEVIQTPNGTRLSAIDPTAEQEWDQRTRTQITGEFRVSADLIDDIGVGDRIPCTASSGRVRLPGNYEFRVAEIKVDIEANQLVLA